MGTTWPEIVDCIFEKADRKTQEVHVDESQSDPFQGKRKRA